MSASHLAIIIPTLNEEHYIGKLLDSIIAQTVLPDEVVVIDAKSQDKTIEEIEKRQKLLPLKYYQIPKYTIARQRNLGVAKTSSDQILFLDADMRFKDRNALERYLTEIAFKEPDIATARVYPDSHSNRDHLCFWLYWMSAIIMQPMWSMVTTQNLYVKRSVFLQNKGFDDRIRVGEDMEFVQRVIKHKALFTFLMSPKVYTSVRRIRKEGRLGFSMKLIKNLIKVQFVGFRRLKVDYEFGTFGGQD